MKTHSATLKKEVISSPFMSPNNMFSFPLLPSFVPVWMFLSELLITKLCTIKSQKKKKKSPLAFTIRHFDISHCCLDTGLCHSESESCTNGTEYESLRDRCAGCDIKNESWAMYTWPERYIHHKFMKETTRRRENLGGQRSSYWNQQNVLFLFYIHTHVRLLIGQSLVVAREAISQLLVWTTSAPATSLLYTSTGLLRPPGHPQLSTEECSIFCCGLECDTSW